MRRPLTVKEIVIRMADLKLSKAGGNDEQGREKLDPSTSGFTRDRISGETGRKNIIRDNSGVRIEGMKK